MMTKKISHRVATRHKSNMGTMRKSVAKALASDFLCSGGGVGVTLFCTFSVAVSAGSVAFSTVPESFCLLPPVVLDVLDGFVVDMMLSEYVLSSVVSGVVFVGERESVCGTEK